jgi:hypothetical protein
VYSALLAGAPAGLVVRLLYGDFGERDLELIVLFRFSYRCPMLWSRNVLERAALAGTLDDAMDDLRELFIEMGAGFSLIVIAG